MKAANKLRLLIAEDVKVTQKLLSAVLDESRYDVDFALNGKEAVELFRGSDYDLVITDIQMPVLDGLSATQQMRNIEAKESRREHTPIIALTAGTSNDGWQDCLDAGMDAYLTKPIALPQLLETVAMLTNGAATNPSKSVDLPTFDYSTALDRLQGDKGLYQSLAIIFKEDHAPLLKSLSLAVAENDKEQILQSAHALRGMAATLGAERVVYATARIEDLAKQDCIDSLSKPLHQLCAEISAFMHELSAFIDSE